MERYAQLRREQDPELPDTTAGDEAGGAAVGPSPRAVKLAIEQEVLYNMGRAFHQAGLNHMAVHFYG